MGATRTKRTNLRRGFSLGDLFWLMFILALLIAILLPSLARARGLAKRAVCAANLRGLGQGMHIYANDYLEWFPHHYFETEYSDDDPRMHGVQWIGTMGSHEYLKITENSSRSPQRNHPSRSLFLMVIGGYTTPKQHICPNARPDVEDDLRNYENRIARAAQPGINRFDFSGYHNLSYGYQLPYGLKGQPREAMDPRMVVAADKSPYFTAGEPGLPGTRTISDKLSDTQVPSGWATRSADDLLRAPNHQWRPYNSRNHRGEGQNALFIDCHVEFLKKPTVGVNGDNIYTLQSDFTRVGNLIGFVPAADQLIGPLTNTDSFIVP
ncbi:MAG: hypothetical protein ABIG44_17920 [Planctomycetota bacterium]